MRNLKTSIARALLCLCLLLLCSVHSLGQKNRTERARAWRQMLAFRNQDLHKLEGRRERIERLANLIVPERKSKLSIMRPRFLWSVTTPHNESRWVLVDFQDGISIPGQAVHDLYFFKRTGELVGSTKIPTGWRQVAGEVKIVRKDDLGLSLLTISTVGLGFTPHRTTRQFYALLGERAVLVRLETKEAANMRNAYGCDQPAFGPPLPERTADEWAKALRSSDTVEVLQALMWLGGRHVEPEDFEYDKKLPDDLKMIRCPEVAAADTALFLKVRGRQDVQQSLAKLAQSTNLWVSEGAKMAITPVDNEGLIRIRR